MMLIHVAERGDVFAVMKHGTLVYYIMDPDERKLIEVHPDAALKYQRAINKLKEKDG